MTSLHYPREGDGDISSKILDDAMRAIDERVTVNRDYHVPYLAGYSKDGKTIYIDSRMPEGFAHSKYDHHRKKWIATDQFLILHEVVEKALLQFFEEEHRPIFYQFAHQIAERAEKAAVEAEDVKWEVYDEFMQHWIKVIGDEGYENIPEDLDLTPYVDEHEKGLPEMEREEGE